MDWPYEPDDSPIHGPRPTWVCPDRTCECRAKDGEYEENEFSIMLTSPLGERMSRALCRVRHGRRILNDHLCADDAGWITVRIDRRLTYVVVDWAPEEGPRSAGYPHKAHHWLELTDEPEESGLRRLHNLGFDTKVGLTQAVRTFQRHYGYHPVTGKLEDIVHDLVRFHDEGRPPRSILAPGEPRGTTPPPGPLEDRPPELAPTVVLANRKPSRETAGSAAKSLDSKVLADFQVGEDQAELPSPMRAQDPPTPPSITLPAQHKQSTGQPGTAFKSVNQAIIDDEALFEFVHIFTEWTNPQNRSETLWGFFWVFSDALMWEVPNAAPFDTWKGTAVAQPFPLKPFDGLTIGDRKRLIRLPVTGEQANRAVEQISVSQAQLLASSGSDLVEPDPDDKRVKCVLPTSRLYDVAFMQAPVKIAPQFQPAMGHRDRVFRYNEAVAKEVDKSIQALNAFNKKNPPGMKPTAVGTPGKIWSLDDGMDKWSCSSVELKYLVACVNHGFHKSIVRRADGSPIRTTQIQTRGRAHAWGHTDYSQIFWAVAGWCLVKDINETRARWRKTRAVYKDGNLFRLVRPQPPFRQSVTPALKYKGTTTDPKPSARCPPLPKNPAP